MNPAPNNLQLRDIHLPEAVSWWPLAPGWWLLVGMIIAMGVIGFFVYRYYQHRRLHRAARLELEKIRLAYVETGDGQRLLRSVSIWLRRVCLSVYPRLDVAGLTGKAWLQFLDEALIHKKRAERFTTETGGLLTHAPYQASKQVDADALLQLCQTWLQCLPRQGRRQP